MANLYVCGSGLAITRFLLQAESTGWHGASTYEHNKRYRFRARFENSFPNLIPSNNAACGTMGIHFVDVRVQLTLSGAIFDGWGQNSGIFPLMPQKVSNHPDFNDTIAPQSARWFEFGYFKWTAASKPASSVVLQIQTFHRFVAYNQFPGQGNILATAA